MDNYSTLNALAAWLSLFISICGLGWQYWCKYPRYKITVDENSLNFSFLYQLYPRCLTPEIIKHLNLTDDGILSPARTIIYVQLSNYSETPITITKAEIFDNKGKRIAKTNHRCIGGNYFVGMLQYNNKLNPYTIDLNQEQLMLPIIIPPYGVKYGYLLFPSLEAKNFTGTLKLFSPIGTETIPINVITFETYKRKYTYQVPKIKRLDNLKN